MPKLIEMLVKLCCCCLLSTHFVRSFLNKDLLEIFPFLSNNYQKTSNMRTGTEMVNLYVHQALKIIAALSPILY